MDRVKKAKPKWDEYFNRWILSQQVSTYGDHELDYACRYDTLKNIDKVPNALFVFDKEPVYEKVLEWKEMAPCWVFRETNVSCGSVAVVGHKDLKVIQKIKGGLFIYEPEEVV